MDKSEWVEFYEQRNCVSVLILRSTLYVLCMSEDSYKMQMQRIEKLKFW